MDAITAKSIVIYPGIEDKVFKQNVLIDKMSGLCWNTIIKQYEKLFDEMKARTGRNFTPARQEVVPEKRSYEERSQ